MEKARIICPLCQDEVDKLLYRYHLDAERVVLDQIRSQNPSWTNGDGICSRCVDYYHTELVMQQRIMPGIGPHFPVRTADDFIVLPTGIRVDADPHFTGKGITICFIDSGFYPHPDLQVYRTRIKAMIDLTDPNRAEGYFHQPDQSSWHGTMTSVVCAGDGFLSHGLYKGIASDADLVLLKVQDDEGRILPCNIEKALHWVLDHYQQYNIRIVNMSLGTDEALSYRESVIDQLADELDSKGVVLVAAVGNNQEAAIKPPANAPSVIAVGGLDDQNRVDTIDYQLYHSSYGCTIDALMKPELIAPAIWVAAPILPGSREQVESTILHSLLQLPDSEIPRQLRESISATQLDPLSLDTTDPSILKDIIRKRIQHAKYISSDYMHVDGTSFAAPIVTAIIAQLLESNPALSPTRIRRLLFSSAKRLPQFPAERQGFGIVHPRKAVMKVKRTEGDFTLEHSPIVNLSQKTITFYMQHDCASQVSLAGSFNGWLTDVLLMEPGMGGSWKIDIPLLPEGRYQYKFFIDDKTWMEDVNNPFREPDGYSGFNSLFTINHHLS